MTSSGSRPPESSQTSHRFTRCRVTSKFGFARLMPDRSSRNTRAALYRGPPIASQYSWNDARYAVGFSWPSSQRTPVTVATRTGRCSRILRAIRGSVWIGRIGIVRTPFFAALGSAAQTPSSPVRTAPARPAYRRKWEVPRGRTRGTRTCGCRYRSPRSGPSRGASDGPARYRSGRMRQSPSVRNGSPWRASVHADDLHPFADPVRRQVHPAGTAALRDDLLDPLLTENLELRLLAGARHPRTSPALVRTADG